jgi:hypothetical protein
VPVQTFEGLLYVVVMRIFAPSVLAIRFSVEEVLVALVDCADVSGPNVICVGVCALPVATIERKFRVPTLTGELTDKEGLEPAERLTSKVPGARVGCSTIWGNADVLT